MNSIFCSIFAVIWVVLFAVTRIPEYLVSSTMFLCAAFICRSIDAAPKLKGNK